MQATMAFVSFSSRDNDVTRRLFARLKAQQLSLWDYSSEGEEIPGGVEITPYLKQRIDCSNLFIPIVTSNSHGSQYTKAEVEYALCCRSGQLTIISLVDKEFDNKVKDWDEPFSRLKDVRYYPVDFSSQEDIEEAIRRICNDIGIVHVPLIINDPRLPFMDKFQAELDRKAPIHEERTNIIHSRLMQAIDTFNASFEKGDYSQCANAMSFFISTCEYEFKGEKNKFYYPYIVKAICLISMGEWNEAQELLLRLMNHDKVDENVFGALGYIKQHLGCYKEAAAYYKKSLELDVNDAAAASGVLINKALSGDILDSKTINDLLALLDKEAANQSERDSIKSDKIKAHVLAALGRSEEAEAIWLRLATKGVVEPDDAINLSRVLVDLGRYEEAIQILEKFHALYPDALDLLHRLATLCWLTGRRDEALKNFKTLVEKAPNNSQYRYDYLYSLWRSGHKETARVTAHEFLHAGLPNGPEDFFRIGFANWILGQEERARYDFERSGQPESEFYSYL